MSDRAPSRTHPRPISVRLHDGEAPESVFEMGPYCPRCGGPMRDRRAVKRFVKSPDYVCRDSACHGAIFPAAPTIQPTELKVS